MSGERLRVSITPATKVADLLDDWPELEDVLVAQAPAFKRLRNPVLRRTVARVATLEQAAGVGGVSVRELVAALRCAAGLEAGEPLPVTAEGPGPATETGPPPPWLDSSRVVATLDADALIDAGQVPLPAVLERVRALVPGEILRIDSGFRPVPLLEALARQGCETFVREAAPGRFESCVRRRRPED